MEERQTNYTIAEYFELPSKGLIYNKKINPQVELRSMTAKEEMQRLSPSNTPLKVLADIIDACLIEKLGMSSYDLCVGDFEYLLQRLRVVSYGDKQKVTVGCPHCGELTETEISIDSLEVKEFDSAEFETLSTLTLPKSNHVLGLQFLTPRILEENQSKVKELQRKFKGSNKNFELLISLTSAISSIDGKKMNQFELENFVDKLPVYDMTKLLNTLDELNKYIGVDNKVYVTCKGCGEEVLTFFRIEDREFFRPSNI